MDTADQTGTSSVYVNTFILADNRTVTAGSMKAKVSRAYSNQRTLVITRKYEQAGGLHSKGQ